MLKSGAAGSHPGPPRTYLSCFWELSWDFLRGALPEPPKVFELLA